MLTKDTGIIDAVQNHPEILEVFAEYGGQGAAAHGIDVDAFIADCNKAIEAAKK